MTTPTTARVPGHTLAYEGRVKTFTGMKNILGRARCSCGELSPLPPPTAARKRWHREHKGEVIAAERSANPFDELGDIDFGDVLLHERPKP